MYMYIYILIIVYPIFYIFYILIFYPYICELLELDSSKKTQTFSLFQASDEPNDVLLN